MSIPTIPKHYKAMLDTIAYTEGTLGLSQNGYDILFSSKTINNWSPSITFGHLGKEWLIHSGDYSTTAAGRYQFLGTTWWELSGKYKDDLGLTKLIEPLLDSSNNKYYYNAYFNKVNQDYIGYKLLESKITKGGLLECEKSPTKFGEMLIKTKLDCTWSSLTRALPVGSKGCYDQAEAGKIVNKSVCTNGCNTSTEEVWSIYKLALSKY